MQPTHQAERYAPLDILRGLALSGVLLVNLLTLFRVSLFAHITGLDSPGGPAGSIVSTLVTVLIEFKAYTLFAFLFGAGIAVQAERAAARGSAARFLLRRFLVLLGVGLIHLLLIWNGDILTLYAVCGLLLIPALGLRVPLLVLGGAALIAVSYFVPLPVPLPSTQAMQLQAGAATRVYAQGGFAEILVFRWHETVRFMLPLLLLTLPKTLGVMLLGVAGWRSELLTARRSWWLPIFVAAAALGIAGTALHIEVLNHIPLAFAYGAAVLLWLPRAPLLAAGGQMALTNYLAQSVVFGLIFYGYGLGQFGGMGVVPAALGGVGFYVAQLLFSRAWLRRFRFGPVEWLWRSLTYGRRQPMLREGDFTLSHGGTRTLILLVFLVAMPLIHVGIPCLLGTGGPHWGWTGGVAGLVNYSGLLVAASGAVLLVWILITNLGEVPHLPPRVRLGLRPARLVQTGPYAWTRHPIYLAEGLLWLGLGLYFGSPVVLAVLSAGAVAVFLWVIPREERALEAYFGDQYRHYRQRVPALPGLAPPARRPPE